MRYILTFSFMVFSFLSVLYGQNIGINETGNPPNTSAGLDVDFTTKGFLPPRLNSGQMFSIVNPARGLMIYNTDTGCPHFVNNNDVWQSMCDNSIAALPTADFTANNFTICENTYLDFTDLSTDNGHAITSWTWSFGGGANPNTSSTQNPSNIYFNTPGVYSISLTATNIYGSDTKTLTLTVAGGCTSCNHTGLTLGDVYGGGVIFDITTDINGCQSGKIVSLFSTNGEAAIKWGNSGLIGASSTTDGMTNTNTIVAAHGNDTYGAKACQDYNGGGFNDWYLGARDEMLTLYNVKSTVNNAITNAGGNPMSSLFYWTSTEANSSTATRINFNDGTFSNLTKTNATTYRVRAIRAFH